MSSPPPADVRAAEAAAGSAAQEAAAGRSGAAPRPWNLVAELTYRCPLRCPYCSNPVDHARWRDGLDAGAWTRVFREAAGLGVVHVGLTGGEPAVRRDLEEIVEGAARAGLYAHLVTSGLPLDAARLAGLAARGLRSVQLSLQDTENERADLVAGTHAHAHKLAVARAVREIGLPLTLNVVLHRHNIDRAADMIALARELGAARLELATVQIEGFAAPNRDALLPSSAQIEAAAQAVERARARGAAPEIVFVLPDWHAGRPKACMGGWGRRTLVIAPDGRVLPCHGAGVLPDLEFWSVCEHPLAACWADAPGMNAYRGEAWMKEPCASCPRRARDHGGCRCQALRVAGDAAAADPACALSPHHHRVLAARKRAEQGPAPRWRYRSREPADPARTPA